MRWQALGGVAVVLITGCPSSTAPLPPVPPSYTKVVISITDPNIQAKVPVCTTAHPCEASYTLRDTTTGSVLATLTVGTTTYTVTPLPPAGHTYSIVVNGQDAFGNPMTSPATVILP